MRVTFQLNGNLPRHIYIHAKVAQRMAWVVREKPPFGRISLGHFFFKKDSGVPSLSWSEAVDEALCFGWIDSKPNKRDKQSFYRFFSKRNPKSNWSKINKGKIDNLIKENRMAPSGLEMVEQAKQSGTWDALNDVDNLIVPEDLQAEFDKNTVAFSHWEGFPPSSKKIILEWILNAKTAPTREKRIKETVEKAAQNLRANHYRQ